MRVLEISGVCVGTTGRSWRDRWVYGDVVVDEGIRGCGEWGGVVAAGPVVGDFVVVERVIPRKR